MRLNRRHALAAILSSAASSTAFAQQAAFPSKPIRLLVPWAAGTPADLAARSVADLMGAELGQAVYVENKNGAAGTVAVPEVLRYPADGHTLYMLASASLVAPVLYPKSDIDFVRQFDAVGQVEWSYNIVCVSPDKPYRSVKELVDQIRNNPGRISYASGGNGTPPHLAGEMLNMQAGLKTNHVPYVQMGQAATDVMTGLVDFIVMGAAGALPQVKAGRLRALAVTSAKRMESLPDVPTMVESGFPEFVIRPFDGLLVRKGAPAQVVEKLNAALNVALDKPTVRERLATIGMEPVHSTPAAFARMMEEESARWIGLARRANLQIY